jgi:hypothetical protein
MIRTLKQRAEESVLGSVPPPVQKAAGRVGCEEQAQPAGRAAKGGVDELGTQLGAPRRRARINKGIASAAKRTTVKSHWATFACTITC